MKVLVIGSGGREHALVWALKKSANVNCIYSATTNAGINSLTVSAPVDASNLNSIADFAKSEKLDLVVVGPEQPLVEGLVDLLDQKGIPAFGPSKAAARLEGSKVFSKEFMLRHSIPTARCRIVDNADNAKKVIEGGELGFPVVIKADGLAAGKGVIIAQDKSSALQAIKDLMIDRKLGNAGSRLVIEEALVGRELSYLVFSDGKTYKPMPVAQDHKRAFDNDEGPNTGGMGAFSIPGLLDEDLEKRIQREIVEPSLRAAESEGFPFKGVLYCGVMVTQDGPKTLEYNTRFGDPETQAILRRLESNFAEIALATACGKLNDVQLKWSSDISTCIVIASDGYPGSYEAGKIIKGIDHAEQLDDVVVFHAGTKNDSEGNVITAGGRVLGVTAVAPTIQQATSRAYDAVAKINFDGMFYRRDIGI